MSASCKETDTWKLIAADWLIVLPPACEQDDTVAFCVSGDIVIKHHFDFVVQKISYQKNEANLFMFSAMVSAPTPTFQFPSLPERICGQL